MVMNLPEQPTSDIAALLRYVRKTLGLPLREAARIAHVSFTYLGQVERGERAPSDSWLRSYIEHLGRHLAEREAAA